jgi:hypothetical protein
MFGKLRESILNFAFIYMNFTADNKKQLLSCSREYINSITEETRVVVSSHFDYRERLHNRGSKMAASATAIRDSVISVTV